MSMQKPALPKGTRDFGPSEMAKRNYILDTIKHTFKLFGFQQLETPAMENLSTLTGKYGDEGDQLLYKILNSGDFLKDVSAQDLSSGTATVLPKVAEKGLRYDLTVPFARYVVMNRNDLAFPFKRFQVQPVWRADRPQRGRYREFFQCDADVVGTDSLICEAEILIMIKRVFAALGVSDYVIKVNNRKILTGISQAIGEAGKEQDLCTAIDKLDKIGWEKVKEELFLRGFQIESISKLAPLIGQKVSADGDILDYLGVYLSQSTDVMNGLSELKEVFDILEAMGESKACIAVDPMLARGLSYYTGAIFEVKVNNTSIGAVSGGGRYDNLTGVFGMPGLSGVGFSFGVDRIFDVLEELGLFSTVTPTPTQAMVAYFGEEEKRFGLRIVSELRNNGVAAEIYPEEAKIKKQFTYADKKNIPFVIIIGSEEMKTGALTFRDMASGEQQKLDIHQIIAQLK